MNLRIILFIGILSTLVPTAALAVQTVKALSPYESGFKHGVSDGKDSCLHPGCHWYILLPGKGFQFHTPEFNRGYVDGFCSVDPHGGSDADVATFDCANR